VDYRSKTLEQFRMPKGKGGASGGAQGKGGGKSKDAPSEGAKGGKKSGAGTAVKVSQWTIYAIIYCTFYYSLCEHRA